jgi:hypothetical protein
MPWTRKEKIPPPLNRTEAVTKILSPRDRRLRNFLERLAESFLLSGMDRKIAQRYDADQMILPTYYWQSPDLSFFHEIQCSIDIIVFVTVGEIC